MKVSVSILTIIISSGAFFGFQDSSDINRNGPEPEEVFVYICNDENSRTFHLNKDCHYLDNCQSEILRVSVDKAKEKGKIFQCSLDTDH